MKTIRLLLFPFSIIWWVSSSIRNLLYKIKVFKIYKIEGLFVISIGNLSLGGNGKSPLVEYLVNLLSNNYKVAILSRGYKRKTNGFVLATENNSSADALGDEPSLYFEKFPSIPIAVCADRVFGAKKLKKLYPEIQILILDDAFQHQRIHRDLNLIVSDSNMPFFKDFLFPAGNLRESTNSLSRADAVIFSKCKSVDFSYFTQKTYGLPTFFSSLEYLQPYFLDKIATNYPEKVVVLSGICNPKPLLEYVQSQTKIEHNFEYADHYKYQITDILKLNKINLPVITTEKDAVKLLKYNNLLKVPVIIQPIGVKFIGNGTSFDNFVIEKIKTSLE